MNDNTYKIGELVELSKYGPFLKSQSTGNTVYLMGKQFNEDSELKLPVRTFVTQEVNAGKHHLVEGDVLFAAKGNRNFAWSYQPEIGQAIASSLFLVLKPKQDLIISQYLHQLINSTSMQHKIRTLAKGNTISSIPRKEFLEIEVKIPPIEEQREIAKVLDTLSEEIRLGRELLEKKVQRKNEIMDHLFKNGLPTRN